VSGCARRERSRPLGKRFGGLKAVLPIEPATAHPSSDSDTDEPRALLRQTHRKSDVGQEPPSTTVRCEEAGSGYHRRGTRRDSQSSEVETVGLGCSPCWERLRGTTNDGVAA
jgi:hypothetical protein